MPKRKNKLNRADRLRRDTAHIEPHKGLKIVGGSFLVIAINNYWQEDPHRDVMPGSGRQTSPRRYHSKTELLVVIFHMKKENKFDPYIPQLQAVVPLYNLDFTKLTLHCYWRRGPNIIEVKRNSELERKITTHPWLKFRRRRLFIKINHTKKYKLRKEIKHVDEREELKEPFFKILPLCLSKAVNIRIEVTPLKRKYLLVHMFNERKRLINKMVLLINGCRNVKKVRVVFRVDERKSDYLNFADCFLGLKPALTLFVVLDGGNGKEIPVGSLVERRIKELRKRSNSGTSPKFNRFTNLCGEMIMAVIHELFPASANSLRACNRSLESIIDPPRL
ncbi:hypothetical protein BPAE_0251g00130 [Botrytis paeoniae]|uniref:Uncharacterized protein n=1 Tax=Botrytis paeoniae TaxID=278948 RepID=A0A4Z1FBW8_9HELO|nr:hypothetical protein BPAE_0251g00130 [Botrytis paeoniae]